MIVAKQMIKTSQILSVGLSLSIGKVREKLQTEPICQMVKYAIQSENQQNQHRPSASFTFHTKKS